MKAPRMTRQHFEFIADVIAPTLSWPTHIETIADKLAESNDRFDRDKFVARATKAWEDNYVKPHIEDYIPYIEQEVHHDKTI